MTRAIRTVVVVLALGALSARAPAAAMDYQLAGAGTQVPYSQLVDAIPTQWELFTQPTLMSTAVGLPEPSVSTFNPSNLAEPARGNPNTTMLGQIVSLGSSGGADRGVWGIYDRLAVIPAPIVLYFDRYLGAPIGITRPSESAGYVPVNYGPGGSVGGGSGGGRSGTPTYTIETVPEPASIALLAFGIAALARRWGRAPASRLA